MNDMKRVALLAACAVLAVAGVVRAAAEDESSAASGFTLSSPASAPLYAAAAPPAPAPETEPPGLLQSQMTQHNMGGSQMESYGIRIHGYAEAGFNYNVKDPPSGDNGWGRLFDDRSQDLKLNQISLTVQRDALVSPDRFDSGFLVQGIFGADARFTQANGTNFYGPGYANRHAFTFFNQAGVPTNFIQFRHFPGQPDPENQIDFLQFYGTFNLPVGNGLLLTAGKFITPWGYEKIDPTQNGFYSHSWMFSLSQPKTLTGLTGRYQIDEQWGVMGGVVVGWDQAFEDNNDFPSLVAQVTYDPSKELHTAFSLIVGPEQESNRSDYRWLLDATVNYRIDNNFTVGAEAMGGYEPDSGTSFIRPVAGANKFQAVTGDDSTWNAIAGYVDYRYDEAGMYIGHFRAEAFNDGDGARLLATQVYSLTGALSIRPWVNDEVGKNFVIRPEIRYDYAEREVFDGNSSKWQITIGGDLVFSF